MACKLFDLAAFGNTAWREPKNDLLDPAGNYIRDVIRKQLRQSVLLSCAEVLTVFDDWCARLIDTPSTGLEEDSKQISEQLQRCKPPWKNTFVYAGPDASCNDPHGPCEFGCLAESLTRQEMEFYDPDCSLSGDDFLVVNTLWKFSNSSTIYRSCLSLFSIDPDGKMGSEMFQPFAMEHENPDARQYSVQLFPMFCFQLLHCRNIVTVQHDPYRPQMPRGKRNKSPKISYHTLKIGSTVVKSEGNPESVATDVKKAKHVCRGNFAHYTEEKPLFGKYVGMFWRPMHIRGSAQHGIVGKEYEMAQPEEKA